MRSLWNYNIYFAVADTSTTWTREERCRTSGDCTNEDDGEERILRDGEQERLPPTPPMAAAADGIIEPDRDFRQ